MNRFRMTKAGINVNEGLQRLFGDMDLYEDLLIKFLDDTSYSEFCSAIEAQDVELAFRAAHSLKGVAGNLSMGVLYDAVVPAVEELRAGNLAVEEYLPAIKEAYDKVFAAIQDMAGNRA